MEEKEKLAEGITVEIISGFHKGKIGVISEYADMTGNESIWRVSHTNEGPLGVFKEEELEIVGSSDEGESSLSEEL